MKHPGVGGSSPSGATSQKEFSYDRHDFFRGSFSKEFLSGGHFYFVIFFWGGGNFLKPSSYTNRYIHQVYT